MLVTGVPTVKLKGTVAHRLLSPRIVGGLEDFRAVGVGELHYAAKVVGMGIVDFIGLPGLLYVHRRQTISAVQVVELLRHATFRYLFVVSGKYSGFLGNSILFENGFPALLVGAVSTFQRA
jgi:hypothetical protein